MTKLKIKIIGVFLILLLYSCDEKNEVKLQENKAPSKAKLTYPSNEAKEVLPIPTFQWTASVDPEKEKVSYELVLSKDKDFKEELTKKAIDIHKTQFSFTNYELERNQKYYWKVISYDPKGAKEESTVYNFTSIDIDLKINLLTPKDGKFLNDFNTEISWETKRNSVFKEDITFSVFMRNGSPEFSYPSKKGLTQTKSKLTNLRGNGTYYWAVAAYDESGTKIAQSQTSSFKTPNTPPSAAVLESNIKEQIVENKINILFHWKASKDPDRILEDGTLRPEVLSYDFYLSSNKDFTSESIKAKNLKELKFLCTELDFNTQYWAKVVTKDENNGIVNSNIIHFTTREKPSDGDVNIAHGTWTDSRDGKTYKTIKINGKTWLAENYAYIPFLEKENDNGEKMICSVYGIDNPKNIEELRQSNNYTKYGVLYSGYCIPNITPSGWHVATDEEWKELEKLSGMTDEEINKKGYRNNIRGKTQHKFIHKKEIFDSEKGATPSNEMHTSILYGGYFSSSWKGDIFKGIDSYTYIWTSTSYSKWGTTGLYYRAFSSKRETIERNAKGEKFRMYVRLVKD